MRKYPNILVSVDKSKSAERKMLRGLTKYAQLNGPWRLFVEINGPWGLFTQDPFRVNIQTKFSKEVLLQSANRIDGVFVHAKNLKIGQEIIKMGIPAVVIPIEKPIPGIPNTLDQWDLLGKIAAEHFIDRGFKNFGYAGIEGIWWSQNRFESFRKNINQAGFEVDYYQVPKLSRLTNWETEERLMSKWVKRLPKPVALLAWNDDFGEHLIKAANIARVIIPDEVAVLGIDDDEIVCDLCIPQLSSISQDYEKIGYEIGQLLDQLMRGQKWNGQNLCVVPTHVTTRQSTDVLAIEDSELATAINYIREESKKRKISVGDVVYATNLSRRALENHFSKELNCSINKKIRYYRVKHLARVLVETDFPIVRIASDMGFSDTKNISSYFQKEMGLTPQAYRKKFSEKHLRT